MEMMETLSDGGNPVHGLALINEIKRYGIKVSTSTRASEIDERGRHRGVRGERLHAAAMPDGAGGGAAVEQLRQVRAGRRRGGEQDALRRPTPSSTRRGGSRSRPRRTRCVSARPSSTRSATAGARGTCWRRRAWPLPSRATCERPGGGEDVMSSSEYEKFAVRWPEPLERVSGGRDGAGLRSDPSE